MPLTNEAVNMLTEAIVGDPNAVTFGPTNTYIGVGDGAQEFDPSQTDLQGTNKLRKLVDAGFPIIAGNTMTLQATFNETEANFAWEEFGVFTNAVGGPMYSRFVEFNGTKQEGQTWVVQFSITLKPTTGGV